MVRTLELTEGQAKFIPECDLDEQLAVGIGQSGFVAVEFPSPVNKRQFVLRPTSVVGLIPIDAELMIRVVPKVAVANLFGMLELVHELPSFEFYKGIGRVDALEDIYDRLARMLARGVLNRVRRGLDSDYVTFDEDLPVLRGQMDIERTLRLRSRGSTRLQCSYEMRTIDVVQNRILLWALDRIPRLGLRSLAAIDEVRNARRALLGSVQLTEMKVRDCMNQRYNRLNSDYKMLHALARFFLERMGPGIVAGDRQFLPFTVNIAHLFQEYVVACLREHAPPGLTVYRQHRVDLGGDLDVRFQMDAVITETQSGRALAVVDAKYKTDAKPSAADIHQVVAYAAHLGAPSAVLVYPTALETSGRATIGLVSRIEVATVGLPLNVELATARIRFAHEIFSRLPGHIRHDERGTQKSAAPR